MAQQNKQVEDQGETEAPSTGCGILGRYPVLSVLAFAACGIGLGIGLSFWNPENPQDKETLLDWIGLIGEMFIRALKAIVLPLVFVNVILSVVDMVTVGGAGSVGWKTIGLYLLTTLLASILGLISIVSFSSLFEEGSFADPGKGKIQLACDENGTYMAHSSDGSISCSANLTEDMSNYFYITDVDGTFVSKSSGPKNDLSLSDTIYDGVFRKLITSNIFESFVEANFAAVVLFAICMGAALASTMKKKGMSEHDSIFVRFLKELDGILLTLINWVIMITPFAVMSLIANAIGKQDDLKASFENVGYLVAATAVAMIAHVCLTYVGLYVILTKKNPFKYLENMLPAQTTAFACASSAATIPVTLQCVKNSGEVPDTIAKFVIPVSKKVLECEN